MMISTACYCCGTAIVIPAIETLLARQSSRCARAQYSSSFWHFILCQWLHFLSLSFSLFAFFTWKCTKLIIIINAPKYSANCTRVPTVRQFPSKVNQKVFLTICHWNGHHCARINVYVIAQRTHILPHFIVIQSISNQFFSWSLVRFSL